MLNDEQLAAKADKAMAEFVGDYAELQGAIGTMWIASRYGWKPVFLVHHRITIQKYERILDIKFRDSFPDVGALAGKSKAWRLADKASNFWKAVRGQVAGIKSPVLDEGESVSH